MILKDIYYLFRNITLNLFGIERDLLQLLQDKDVNRALTLMRNNEDRVDQAIMEYYPEKHKINSRPNKRRKNQLDYISTKTTRKRQQFINEVALFFLLNNKIKWTLMDNEGLHDEEFKIFNEYLRKSRFDSVIRQAKRLAGAETESAIFFHIYRNEGNEPQCQPIVLARSTGYELRPLIDQYNTLRAFAYGYKTQDGERVVQHWDFQTEKLFINCTKGVLGWEVDFRPNPTGKINIIYFQQDKEWDGVQGLCDREEDVMSRISDNNNYFSDPIAKASADVIENMMSPESIGKFVQMEGDSVFDYITPPNIAEGWRVEKEELKSAILNDSFTPDFTYEGIKGYGTLSGSALRNALVIGYIKRSKNLEVWEAGVSRAKNVIIQFLKLRFPKLKWDSLEIDFEFSDPFEDTQTEKINLITSAKNNGVMSMRTAVQKLAMVDDIDKEIQQIEQEQSKSTIAEPTEKGE